MSRLITRMAIVTLAFAMAAPAQAQLRGLVKRAATKTTGQNQVNPNARPSSAFGPELTEQTITSVLKGLEAEQQILNQRDVVAKQMDALTDASSKLLEPHEAEREAFNKATDKWNECRSVVFERLDKQQQMRVAAAQQALASDPAKVAQFQQKIMALQMKVMQAMQRGDTAGAQKLSADFARTQSGANVDPKADTVQAAKECGTGPVKPDWLAQSERNYDKANILSKQIRDLEEKAAATGVSASGLSAEQFAQSRERLVNWFRGGKDSNSVQQFGKGELALIHEHQAEIEKLERVL